MFGRRMKLKRREEIMVEDVEKYIERIKESLPVDDKDAPLVEVVRWLGLVEKSVSIVSEKMEIDDVVSSIAITNFMIQKMMQNLYAKAIVEIAETLLVGGMTTEDIPHSKLSKNVKALAFLTSKSYDEVIRDVEEELKRRGSRK